MKPTRRSLRVIERYQAKIYDVNDFNHASKNYDGDDSNIKYLTHNDIDLIGLCPKNQTWSFVPNRNSRIECNQIENSMGGGDIGENVTLPQGSQDLNFIPNLLLMPIIGLYDCCIKMRNILRLAPFRFEDFCFCLTRQGQSSLLAAIFMAFLRIIFNDDEANGITYFTTNEKDYSFIFFQSVDEFTWVEAVKIYFASSHEHSSLYKNIVNKPGFPLASSINDKVDLLIVLYSNFIVSTTVINTLSYGSINLFDTLCTYCGKSGEIRPCSICSRVYHLECLDSSYNLDQLFVCPSCHDHSTVGISNEDLRTFYNDSNKRLEPLGVDHLGRLYWFTIRRIFVEDSTGKVTYYSTVTAIKNLLLFLSSNKLNKQLIINISTLGNIWEQVNKTIIMITKECLPGYVPIYTLDSTNAHITEFEKLSNGNTKYYYIGMNDNYLGYVNYYLPADTTVWNYGLSKKTNYSHIIHHNLLWHGGFDQFKKDVNDLKKCNGASYRVINEFAYLKMIQNTLINFESHIPSPYLNPVWYHQLPAWAKCVRMASSPAKLASLILLFYQMIKPFAFQCCWYESRGHHLPCKIFSIDNRSEKSMKNKPHSVLVRNFQTVKLIKELADNGEFVNVDAIVKDMNLESHYDQKYVPHSTHIVKYNKIPKHRIWLQRGEEYRTVGGDGWCLVNKYSNDVRTQLTQSQGVLDRIINSIIMRKKYYTIQPNDISRVPDSSSNELPSLVPLGTLESKMYFTNEENTKNNSLSISNFHHLDDNNVTNPSIGYIPGESVLQFYQRKGSSRLVGIEREMKSTNKPLVTNSEILMSRELKHFIHYRKIVSRMTPIFSVYRINSAERFRLGRKGGTIEIKGFNYYSNVNKSSNIHNWPSCFPHPSIGRIWETRMLNVSSIFDIAYLLKVLYSCLDMDNLRNMEGLRGMDEIIVDGIDHHTTPVYCKQTEEGIATDEILDARLISSDGLVYSYQIKKTVQPTSVVLNEVAFGIHGNNLVYNKDGKIDVVLKRSIDVDSKDVDDGRYVSSFRKSLVPPETLVNDHALRSTTNRGKPNYKHVSIVWIHENDVNTILIKRFWSMIEKERTMLQTEYTFHYKRWLQYTTYKNNQNLKPLEGDKFATQVKLLQNPLENTEQQLPQIPVINSSVPKPLFRYELDNIKPKKSFENGFDSLSSTGATTEEVKKEIQSNIIPNNTINSKNDESNPQSNRMNYGNVVLFQRISEEKQLADPKINILYTFKIEKLLNSHSEYLKTNLRRNKFISRKQANQLANNESHLYRSFLDIEQTLDDQYLQDEFFQNKTLKSNDKLKCHQDKLTQLLSQNSTEWRLRRSNRESKPKKYSIEFTDSKDMCDSYLSTNVNNQSRIDCCCPSKNILSDGSLISCNGCHNLYHGTCYGMTNLKSSIMNRFYCPSCELNNDDTKCLLNTSRNDHYILNCVCGETNVDITDSTTEIIRCQICHNLCHTRCINFPYEQLKCLDLFVCDDCKSTIIKQVQSNHPHQLSLVGIRALMDFLNKLKNYEFSHPFLHPVDINIVLDYTQYIKNPMDIQTISENLGKNLYPTLLLFVKDLQLIFENCRMYNSKETFYVKYANCMECIVFLYLRNLCRRTDLSSKT